MPPLVYVTGAFIAGVTISGGLSLSYPTIFICIFASLVFIPAMRLAGGGFTSLFTVPLFFFLGILFITPYIRPEIPKQHIKNFIDDPASIVSPFGMDVEGVVAGDPEESGRRTKLYVNAERVMTAGGWRNTSGRVLLRADDTLKGLRSGDRVRFLSELSEPWNYGNPGEFDYRGWLNMRGVFATGFVKSAKFIVKTGDREPGFLNIARLRDSVSEFIDRSGIEHGGALKALITGEKHDIPPLLKGAFRKSGTAHILAISGLHVGMVALFAYSVFIAFMKISERLMLAVNIKKAALLASLVPVIFYGAVADFPLSTLRAVLMVGAFIVTFVINRGKEHYNTLALAAMVILLISPYSVWDVSFQLSFVAVLSIIYLVPRCAALLKAIFQDNDVKGKARAEAAIADVRNRFLKVVLVTVSAGLGTAPILAYHFNTITPVGVIANLIVVPLVGFVVPMLFLSTITFSLWEGLASVFLHVADFAFSAIVATARFFSALSYASFPVATPSYLDMILFYAIVVSLVNILKVDGKEGTEGDEAGEEGKKIRISRGWAAVTASVVVILISLQVLNHIERTTERNLRLTFISVGQGDSILVEFPGGTAMLVDGGGIYGSGFDVGERIVAPFLWSRGITRLDYVVLSHAQRDHMGGLAYTVGSFLPREFWWNGVGSLGALEGALKRAGTETRVLDNSAGKVIIGSDNGANSGVAVEILHPPARDEDGVSSGLREIDINGTSLVLRLTYGEKSFLLSGDIGEDAERLLSENGVSANVLKSPHHGSRYSSSEGFLASVAPEVVVISAGRQNPFGFPHMETLGRYSSIGAEVYRTDLLGAINVSTDGISLKVKPYLTGDRP